MVRLLVILCGLVLAGGAAGGHWPRDRGTAFASLSYAAYCDRDELFLGFPQDGYLSLYLEYGATSRLTLGIEAGADIDGNFKAFAFARLPVGPGTGPFVFALRAGAGAVDMGQGSEAAILAGASLGRGFTSRLGDVWFTAEASGFFYVNQGRVATKAEATLGLKPYDRLKLMMQLQAGDYPDSDPYLRLAPSVAYQVRQNMHVQLGAEAGIVGDTRIGISLGTWLEF